MVRTNNIPFDWVPIKVNLAVKNWGQNKSGTQIRIGNYTKAYYSILSGINHLCTFHPRILFNQSHGVNGWAYLLNSNGQNYYNWLLNDVWNNNKTYEVKIIYRMQYPLNGSGYGRFYDANSGSDVGSSYLIGSGLLEDTDSYGWEYTSFIVNKETITDGFIENGIVSTNTASLAFTILDICIQEKPNIWADESYTICRNNLVKANEPITDVAVRELNDNFHDMRQYHLPIVLSWSGWNDFFGTQPTNIQGFYNYGIAVTTNSYLNVQDFSSDARTATTPGFSSHCYKGGVGKSDNVRVRCAVYAKVGNSGNVGWLKFEGPDHAANNYTEIAVSGTNYAWLTDEYCANHLYLNAASQYTDTTTERNKIDIFAKVGGDESVTYPLYAVGANNTQGEALVLKYQDDYWVVDGDFPEESGTLYGIYAYAHDDVWVCGSTGASYGKQGMLYHWDGSSWTSYLDDALTALGTSDGDEDTSIQFYGCDGIATDDIVFCGWRKTSPSGTSDGWILEYDGASFTTVTGIDLGNDAAWAVSVSPGGDKFVRTNENIYSNSPGYWGLATFIDNVNSYCWNSIKAFANDDVLCVRGEQHWTYDGASWSYDTVTSGGGDPCDGISSTNFWVTQYQYPNQELIAQIESGAVSLWGGDGIAPTWTANLHDVLVIDNSDVWVCGNYETADSSPVLSHFNGSVWSESTVSGTTDNINLYTMARADTPTTVSGSLQIKAMSAWIEYG